MQRSEREATFQALDVKPIVLLCGDQQQQQQSITNIDVRTLPTTGVLHNKELYKNSVVTNFIHQHRCTDPELQQLLKVIRYYTPSSQTLNNLYDIRVLCPSELSEAELLNVLQTYPDAMILTVSKAATNPINKIAVRDLFPETQWCSDVPFDNEDIMQPIYPGMRTIITQNVDKSLHTVKEQHGTILTMENQSVFANSLTMQQFVCIQ